MRDMRAWGGGRCTEEQTSSFCQKWAMTVVTDWEA